MEGSPCRLGHLFRNRRCRGILNSISRARDLDADPDLTSSEFDRINATLRGMLAKLAALKSAEAGRLDRAVEVATAGKDPAEEYACIYEIGELLEAMGDIPRGPARELLELQLWRCPT